MTIICDCGRENPERYRFCSLCGSSLTGPAREATTGIPGRHRWKRRPLRLAVSTFVLLCIVSTFVFSMLLAAGGRTTRAQVPAKTVRLEGKVVIPEGVPLKPGELTVAFGVGNSVRVSSGGAFAVDLTDGATALVSVKDGNGDVVLRAIAPMQEYFRGYTLELSPRSSALAILFMNPGIVASDPVVSLFTLGYLYTLKGTRDLADIITRKMKQDPAIVSHPDDEITGAVVSTLQEVYSEASKNSPVSSLSGDCSMLAARSVGQLPEGVGFGPAPTTVATGSGAIPDERVTETDRNGVPASMAVISRYGSVMPAPQWVELRDCPPPADIGLATDLTTAGDLLKLSWVNSQSRAVVIYNEPQDDDGNPKIESEFPIAIAFPRRWEIPGLSDMIEGLADKIWKGFVDNPIEFTKELLGKPIETVAKYLKAQFDSYYEPRRGEVFIPYDSERPYLLFYTVGTNGLGGTSQEAVRYGAAWLVTICNLFVNPLVAVSADVRIDEVLWNSIQGVQSVIAAARSHMGELQSIYSLIGQGRLTDAWAQIKKLTGMIMNDPGFLGAAKKAFEELSNAMGGKKGGDSSGVLKDIGDLVEKTGSLFSSFVKAIPTMATIALNAIEFSKLSKMDSYQCKIIATGCDIVLVMDISGSMGGSKLGEAKTAAGTLINLAQSKAFGRDLDIQIGLAAFAEQVYMVRQISESYQPVISGLYSLQVIAVGDPQRPETWINNTNITSGIRMATEMLLQGEKGRKRMIFLFSDGQHNVGPPPGEAVANARANGIIINTIGLYDPQVKYLGFDGPALEAMASSTGGIYTLANGQEDLSGAFIRMLHTIASDRVIDSTGSLDTGSSRVVKKTFVVPEGEVDLEGTIDFDRENAVEYQLKDPDGNIIDSGSPSASIVTHQPTYGHYIIRSPKHGTWTVEMWSAGDAVAQSSSPVTSTKSNGSTVTKKKAEEAQKVQYQVIFTVGGERAAVRTYPLLAMIAISASLGIAAILFLVFFEPAIQGGAGKRQRPREEGGRRTESDRR